jgi:hypothetical protein
VKRWKVILALPPLTAWVLFSDGFVLEFKNAWRCPSALDMSK